MYLLIVAYRPRLHKSAAHAILLFLSLTSGAKGHMIQIKRPPQKGDAITMERYHYTEADFASKSAAQTSLLRLLDPLKPFYSPGGARVELGATSAHYENDAVPMEAFARPLWGLVPFWAGGGRDAGFEALVTAGLTHGPDPAHPDYWHTCRDFDQKFCEMPAIAYGLLFAQKRVWDPLSAKAKDELTEWLWEIDRHECCACNWQWFAVLTNLALKVVGRPYSRERIESGLAMMEDYYDAGGWYRDGAGGEKDYYNPFVMVSFGLLYAIFMQREDPERCAQFRRRAHEFARDFLHWFAGDGAAIAYGRSMTYRFAQASFFAVSLLAGEEVLPLPVLKGLLVRQLVWWLNRPIFDNAGVLSIGYGYPNLQMAESYNAPGSPYWAFFSFAFLALPDDHPFWAAACAPLPALPPCRYLPHANMILQRDAGNVVALVPGRTELDEHSHTVEKYCKFAYSSRFGFSVSRAPYTLAQTAPDSMLCFKVGRLFYVKDIAEPDYAIGEEGITVRWSPLEGIRVTTRILPTPEGHLREHTIESEFACEAYDCGFALSADDRQETARTAEGPAATVRCEGDFCTAVSLEGGGRGEVLIPDPNTNLICPKTAIPMAVYAIHKGCQRVQTRFDYLCPAAAGEPVSASASPAGWQG